MENKFLNRKYIIWIDIVILCIIVFFLAKMGINALVLKNEIKNSEHGITISKNVHMYSSPKEKKKYDSIEIGSDAYILKSTTDKENTDWYKVKIGDKVGYVKAKEISKYKKTYQKRDLMLDVSKFNMQNNFKSIGEFKAFVLNNNIKFVYIRAGGRGYGQAGNFYTDPYADDYANACDFLGIPFGYYFLEEAITSEEVDEEIEFINQYLREHSYKNNVLPIAIDVEKHVEAGRADSIWNTRYQLVNELIDKFEDNNKKVILYSNANIADEFLENVNTQMWLAYYPSLSSIPNYWYSDTDGDGALNKNIITKMVGWQFTQNGITDVINEKVDISLVYSNYLLNNDMQDVENDIKETNEMVFGPINKARKNLLDN
ncbi:MAG: hypothetical protein IJH12_06695 [Clostridia bacterium]|nr:hypothetical protein [Clostridia bacterium]